MGAFQDLNVAGFLKQSVLSFIPVAQFVVPAQLAVGALKKALGIKGAPPPVAGLLLLDAVGVSAEVALATAPPKAGTLPGALNAEDAEYDVARAIWTAHGLDPDTTKFVSNPIFTLAGGGLKALAMSPAEVAAREEWESYQATFIEINLAFRDHGVERVVEVLEKPVHKTRWLKAQLMFLQYRGKSVKGLKQLLKAAEEAAAAAKAFTPEPAGLEDAPVGVGQTVTSAIAETTATAASAASGGAVGVGQALLGFANTLLGAVGGNKSTQALEPSTPASTPASGDAAASVGVMSPALVVALLLVVLLVVLLAT